MKFKVGDIIVIEKSIFKDYIGHKATILQILNSSVIIKFLNPDTRATEHEIDGHKIRHLTKLEKSLL